MYVEIKHFSLLFRNFYTFFLKIFFSHAKFAVFAVNFTPFSVQLPFFCKNHNFFRIIYTFAFKIYFFSVKFTLFSVKFTLFSVKFTLFKKRFLISWFFLSSQCQTILCFKYRIYANHIKLDHQLINQFNQYHTFISALDHFVWFTPRHYIFRGQNKVVGGTTFICT